MMKTIAGLLLDLILVQYILLGLAINQDYLIKNVIYKWTNKYTYVSTIQGDPEDVAQVKEALEKFNNMGGGNIVHFVPPKKGWYKRPVEIEVRAFNTIWEDGMVGWASAESSPCTIALKKISDARQLELVTIHEYLHCMGYLDHSPDPNDVMYFESNVVDDSNILKYAQELEGNSK